MIDVRTPEIKRFVNKFINNAIFMDLPPDQLEDLKKFLIEYLEELYVDYPNDVHKVIEKIDMINPFMMKLALGFGLLQDDVYDISRMLFMKVNEFFYKKGSLEVLQNLTRVFEYYSIETKIKKVVYDKTKNAYELEDIFTGEREPAPFDEALIPGHLVSKETYHQYSFTDEYQTIVIYLHMNMVPRVSEKMQNPIALLHAYAISKHRDNEIQFYIKGTPFKLTLDESLQFLRYLYLRYLQIKNPDFDLDESGLELWSLYITDPADLELAEELLTDLVNGEYNSRSGMDYFVRISTRILNKYLFNTKPRKIAEIRKQLIDINEKFTDLIDSMEVPKDFEEFMISWLVYLQAYVESLPVNNEFEKYVKNTVNYLFMFIAFILVQNYEERIKESVFRFKKYFLPIYTQFYFDINRSFKIKNDFHRLYTEEIFKVTFGRKFSSFLVDLKDHYSSTLIFNRHDYPKLDFVEYNMRVVGSKIIDNYRGDKLTLPSKKRDLGAPPANAPWLKDYGYGPSDSSWYGYYGYSDYGGLGAYIYKRPDGSVGFKDKRYALSQSNDIYRPIQLNDFPGFKIHSKLVYCYYIQDREVITTMIKQHDRNIVLDSITPIPTPRPKEVIRHEDKFHMNLLAHMQTIYEINDHFSATPWITTTSRQTTIDSITPVPTPSPKEKLSYKDDMIVSMFIKFFGEYEIRDRHSSTPMMKTKNGIYITDAITPIPTPRPKEIMRHDDRNHLYLLTDIKERDIIREDIMGAAISMWLKDSSEIFDAPHTIIIPISRELMRHEDRYNLYLLAHSKSVLEQRDKNIIEILPFVYDSVANYLSDFYKNSIVTTNIDKDQIKDKWITYLYTNQESVLATRDTNTSTSNQIHKEPLDIVDSVTITIT